MVSKHFQSLGWIVMAVSALTTIPSMGQVIAEAEASAWRVQPRIELSSYSAGSLRGSMGSQQEWIAQPQLKIQHDNGQSVQLSARLERSRHGEQHEMQEAWWRLQQDAMDIRLGWQVFNWATTDTVSPGDVFNPRDWRDPTRPRKRAVPALSVQIESEHQWQAVLGHAQTVSLLPAHAWRQSAPVPLQNAAPRYASDATQAALRYTSNWRGTDVNALLYRGHAYAPLAQLGATPAGLPQIEPQHDRLNAVALGFTRQVAVGTLLRAEWVTFKHAQTQSFTQAAINLDHEWADILQRQDSLYLLAQYQADRNIGATRPALPGSFDVRRIFDRQWLARLQYKPRGDERWLMMLETSLDPQRRQRLSRASVQHRPTDALQLELGWIGVRGDPGSFWGQYGAQSRWFVQASWTY
jgi:hypothetical protein